MAAKKKPVTTWSLADLGVDAAEVGLGASWSTVVSSVRRPARTAGQMVKDEGEGGAALADFLAGQRFI
jgi:electron transfer flavoprotein beta subunit